MTSKILTFILCLTVLGIGIGFGCKQSPDISGQVSQNDEQWQNQVTVVSYPMYAALRSICNSQVDLYHPIVPAGQAIDRETTRRIQASRLIILDGTHHAGWVDTVALPETRKRLSTFEILDQLILVDNLGSHSHGPGGEHSHSGIVAQTWLDPRLYKLQVKTVLESFVRAGLLEAKDVEPMVAEWWKTMQLVDEKIEALSQQPARLVMADQAGSEYLFRRLGWPVEIQELDRAAATDPSQLLSELQTRSSEEPGLIVVQTKEPTPELAGIFRQSGLPILQLDLLEAADDQDYPSRLLKNLGKLEELLSLTP